jgi:transposase InsO family protein
MRQAVAGVDVNQPRRARVPVYRYGLEVIEALTVCWAVLDGPAGKLLARGLPDLVTQLRVFGELVISDETASLLMSMSPATIDRRLKPCRDQLELPGRGRSLTKPGSMLKSQIPLKTWREWDDRSPGFVEIDLVGHDGGDNNGAFYYTLDAVDVATGWNEAITITTKSEKAVTAGLEQLQLRFPFPILGIHCDNGSEFINHHLFRWCTTRQITFTRGRANHSNDQAFIEQRNWSTVRRAAGYFRYDTPTELKHLNDLWPVLTRLTNYFLPQQRLATKTRQGAKVTKTYDDALTPAARLLTTQPDPLDPIDKRLVETTPTSLNPAALRRTIALHQSNLIMLAKRRGPVPQRPKHNHVYLSRTKITRAKPHESTNQPKRAI